MTKQCNSEINTHVLKREIKYYSRRSIKEMDAMVARFVSQELDTLSPENHVQLRDLLLLPDEPIRHMLEGTAEISPEFDAILPILQQALTRWRA